MRLLLGLLSTFGILLAQQSDPDWENALKAHQAGNLDAAAIQYRSFLNKKPGSFEARANLGVILAKQGLFDEAVLEYKQALKLAPTNPGISYNLALAHYKSGDFKAAARELSALRALVGDKPQIILLLGDCYLQSGENQKAISLLESPAAESPADLGLAYVLGIAYLREKRVDEGQRQLDKILSKGESAEALLLMGTSKFSAGDFPNALKDFQRAALMNTNLPTLNGNLGQALMATGDTANATTAFQAELVQNPNDFVANLQLGVIFKQDENFEAALRHFSRALRARAGDVGVRYQIAAIHLAQANLEPARSELESLVKEAPNFTEAHVSLATLYYRLKRKEDGDRHRAIVQRLNAEAQEKQPKGQPVP